MKNFIKKIVMTSALVILSGPGSCKADNNKEDMLLQNIIVLLAVKNYIDTEYFYKNLFNEAQSNWQIGLTLDRVSAVRDLTAGTIPNPKNWLTVTPDNCDAIGVPDFAKSNCYFNNPNTPSVIGVCWTSSYSTGEIVHTTVMLKKSWVKDISPNRALMAAVHEIGHCVGLKHMDNINYIMYPYVTDNPIPHQDELNAVKYVYFDPFSGTREPIIPHINHYNVLTTAKRHYTFPVFTISAEVIPARYSSTARNLAEEIIQNRFPECAGAIDFNNCLKIYGKSVPGEPIDPTKEIFTTADTVIDTGISGGIPAILTTAHLLMEDGSERLDIYKAGKLTESILIEE